MIACEKSSLDDGQKLLILYKEIGRREWMGLLRNCHIMAILYYKSKRQQKVCGAAICWLKYTLGSHCNYNLKKAINFFPSFWKTVCNYSFNLQMEPWMLYSVYAIISLISFLFLSLFFKLCRRCCCSSKKKDIVKKKN